jgi:ParB-like chromosome segregation protein Spo0J
MATASHAQQTIALAEIRVPDNVRDLDSDDVAALARSIALQGMLVPVVVHPVDDGFELVAGFHRAAAAAQLGLDEIPAVVSDTATRDADRAVENIARKQLNPYEEARAVSAMLDRRLTENGATDVLGWLLSCDLACEERVVSSLQRPDDRADPLGSTAWTSNRHRPVDGDQP